MKKTLRLVLCAVAYALCISTVSAQPTVVQAPSLSIAGSTVGVNVDYDVARAVYRYHYTISAAETNQGKVNGIELPIDGTTPRPQLDPSLQNNVPRDSEAGFAAPPATTIPVGIVVPIPAHSFSGVSKEGRFYLASMAGTWELEAGASMGGIILESKLPPGPRVATLTPSTLPWTELEETSPPDAIFEPDSPEIFAIEVPTIGPIEPNDSVLYSGGGQQPAEVNKFLRFAQPTESRVDVPMGTSAYTIIVYYGESIKPSTFSATLNGIDITDQFSAIPGTAQVIAIPLISGTTKLHLSTEGTKSSGARGTDSDTITFLTR